MKPLKEMSMGELAAYVCSHLKTQGIDVVLSGGGCVAIYSSGKYVSYDLDFIERLSLGRRKLKAVLAAIGFEESDKYFRHPDTEYFVEFPAGPLAIGGEPPQEIRILKFSTGELTALSPTDCVKDRLAAYFYWNDLECLEQAMLVATDAEIDFEEIERWAGVEGQAEKCALFKKQCAEVVREYRK